jgi:hypothetical protein
MGRFFFFKNWLAEKSRLILQGVKTGSRVKIPRYIDDDSSLAPLSRLGNLAAGVRFIY